jgi:hypothetical protein
MLAHLLKQPVIVGAMSFQVQTQIEKRLAQLPLTQRYNVTSKRPILPLPSRNGWMVSGGHARQPGLYEGG